MDNQTQTASSPNPRNASVTIGGRQVANQNYNSKTKTFNTNVDLAPDQQRSMEFGQKAYADLLPQVQSALATSPQERESFISSLYDPQAQNLRQEYDKTVGTIQGAATATGGRGSVGSNYRLAQADKSLGQGLGQLRNQAELQAYELPNLKLSPISGALGIYDQSAQAPFTNAMSTISPLLQSWGAGNQLLNQQFMQNQQAQAAQRARGGGFLSSLF
jgi:hypothetical protein